MSRDSLDMRRSHPILRDHTESKSFSTRYGSARASSIGSSIVFVLSAHEQPVHCWRKCATFCDDSDAA
jgi:hypothetical protein